MHLNILIDRYISAIHLNSQIKFKIFKVLIESTFILTIKCVFSVYGQEDWSLPSMQICEETFFVGRN